MSTDDTLNSSGTINGSDSADPARASAAAGTIASGAWQGWDPDEAAYWAKVLLESGIGIGLSFDSTLESAALLSDLPITRDGLRADLFERGILPEVVHLVEVAERWRSQHGPGEHAAWLARVAQAPRPAPSWAIEPATWRVRDARGEVHTVSTEQLLAAHPARSGALDASALSRVLGLGGEVSAIEDEASGATENSSTANATLATGPWRGWSDRRARDWAAVLFAFRRDHFVAPHKREAYERAWEKFRAWGELPSFAHWPVEAADFEARGLTPDDFAHEQLAAGRTPHGEPGRAYREHARSAGE